jgi:hypothetical protein
MIADCGLRIADCGLAILEVLLTLKVQSDYLCFAISANS